MVSRNAFNATCTLQAPVQANTTGRVTTTWPADTATGVPCRIWPASATERSIADMPEGVVTHRSVFIAGTTLGRDWHVVSDGITYNVLHEISPSTDGFVAARLEELQAGA